MASTGTAFVYGTLMADEVLRLLIRRVPVWKPATLSGYSRHRVKGQVFPAIIPSASPQDRVQGKVLMELTPSELHILDGQQAQGCFWSGAHTVSDDPMYESEEYYRANVQPQLDDGSSIPADVYIWKDQYRHLLDGEWSYDEWRTSHLDAWVAKLSPHGAHPTGELLN